MYNLFMINFLKKLFNKEDDKDEMKMTISFNGETKTTNDREEIAEFLKKFSETLKEKN